MYQLHEPRIAALLLEPIRKRKAIQILELRGAAEFERNGKFAGRAEFCEKILEMLKLVAVFLRETDGGLDAVLPAAVEKKPLLRREAEIALIPLAVLQHAEIFEQFADVHGLGSGNRHVMRGPGIRADFVFAPARVSSGLRIHFQNNEIREAALAQTPRRAESGDSSAHDDDGNFLDALRRRKRSAVAQQVAHLKGIVDERACNWPVRLERESDERCASTPEKFAASNLQ